MSIIIAVDAMGGDKAPDIVIEGLALNAVRHPDVFFHIYGPEEVIKPLLEAHPSLQGRYTVFTVSEVIPMDMKPSVAIRKGKKSSMAKAIEAVANGDANAVISAGNTGALMALSKLKLRMIDGINRPAIASIWPTVRGEMIMLDMGATIEATSQQLMEFALMGSEYSRIIFDKRIPKVGLLNVGSEKDKGNDSVKGADSLLQEVQKYFEFDYIGFVEGNDITKGEVDVVVTDGFTGNIALKTAEGTAKLIGNYLKAALGSTFMSKVGAYLARKALYAFKEKINPQNVNGGVFLGLGGITVKSHGGANGWGFAAATDLAIDLAKGDIVRNIADHIAQRETIE